MQLIKIKAETSNDVDLDLKHETSNYDIELINHNYISLIFNSSLHNQQSQF